MIDCKENLLRCGTT